MDSVLSDSDLKLKLLNLERLLAQTVQLSQTLTQARGATVADAVIMVLEDRGVQEAPDLRQDIPDCQAALARTVAAEAPPCGWVATAIHGAGEQAESRAFSIISLAGALFVVDGHRHTRSHGPRGLLLARVADGNLSDRAERMAQWIWEAGGLLDQLNCSRRALDCRRVRDLPEITELVDPHPNPAQVLSESVGAQPFCHVGHVTFRRGCDQCRWRRNQATWEEVASFTHRLTGERCTALRERSDPWGLGCILCASHHLTLGMGPGCKWANFQIRGTGVSLDSVRKHIQTDTHRAALLSFCGVQAVDGVPSQVVVHQEPDDLVGRVPRASAFQMCLKAFMQGRSARSYARSHPNLSEANSNLTRTGVFRDESRHAARKMVTCAGAVLDREQQALLGKAVRIAFAEDDRRDVRVLRVRVVWTSPRVGYQEFVGGLLRGVGGDAHACKTATLQALRQMCFVRRGRQPLRQSEADGRDHAGEIDETLWATVQREIFSGATDGAPVALKGVSLLKREGILPNLRYQFRDRPHTTRTVTKMTLGLCPESEALRKALITGKNSFARRAKNSARFREIWIRKQREEPDRFWEVLRDLSYAEQRFDSRSAPMTAFLLKLGPALEVLQEIANSVRYDLKDERAWAMGLLKKLTGPQGFINLVMFAMDTDFAVITHRLTRVQDQSTPDVSLHGHQMVETLDMCSVLFRDLRVFDKEPNGTYTNSLLHSFSKVERTIILQDGIQQKVGWPTGPCHRELFDKLKLHAQKLYEGQGS